MAWLGIVLGVPTYYPECKIQDWLGSLESLESLESLGKYPIIPIIPIIPTIPTIPIIPITPIRPISPTKKTESGSIPLSVFYLFWILASQTLFYLSPLRVVRRQPQNNPHHYPQ